MKNTFFVFFAAFVVIILFTPLFVSAAPVFERVSVDGEGAEGDGASSNPTVSSDCQYVAFQSNATNLVADDTNELADIFVYDRTGDVIERVSVDGDGLEAENGATAPFISLDGRYVTFQSNSELLVPDDTNGVGDIFVYDRTGNTIERVSVDGDGLEADGASFTPALSSDGRYVVFNSDATNLVADDTNDSGDIFVYDRTEDSIERVSVDSEGVEADSGSEVPAISSDGQYVAFRSFATNLVADDTNGATDIFVHDRDTGDTERVSVDGEGAESDGHSRLPSISEGGQFVAFESDATNLVPGDTNEAADIFVYDRTEDSIERVSVDSEGVEGNASSKDPFISSDGQRVAFYSDATNLVAGDTAGKRDVFVYDRDGGTIERVSESEEGAEGDNSSITPALSSDGFCVAFGSSATNLVADDTNSASDIFVLEEEASVEEEPPAEEPPAEEDNSGGGTSFRRGGGGAEQTQEELVKDLMTELIKLLEQLIQALITEQQANQ